MPRYQPLSLNRQTLAEFRPSTVVAVEWGAPSGVPSKRPEGYRLAASVEAAVGPLLPRGPVPASPAIVQIRGAMLQRAEDMLCGEADGYDTIEARVCGALRDPNVTAVLLDTDTPGGDVAGLEQCIAQINREQARSGKPILGWVNEHVASGGVWLLSGVCVSIWMPLSGRMGSVGAMAVHGSEARKLKREGRDIYVARRPDGKAKPNPVEPLDAIGKARLDELVFEASERFFAFVSARRHIAIEQVRAMNAALFTGPKAVTVGLCDGIGSFEEVIALAAKLAAVKAQAA